MALLLKNVLPPYREGTYQRAEVVLVIMASWICSDPFLGPLQTLCDIKMILTTIFRCYRYYF